MRKYLIKESGKFYKANLHCHTNLSDAVLTPEEIKELYKSEGYSAVAFTDHDILIPHHELSDDEFIALSGFEMSLNILGDYPAKGRRANTHLCMISGKKGYDVQPCYSLDQPYVGNAHEYAHKVQYDTSLPPFKKDYFKVNEIIKIAREKGFFVTYNHPSWSLEDFDRYTSYRGLNAMEIYNHATDLLGFTAFDPGVYDSMLRSGQRIFTICSDDNHNKTERGKGGFDSFGGFVMIKADKLDYESLMQSLFNGDFYSSQGPKIHSLYIEGDEVTIECEDLYSIYFSTDTRYARVLIADDNKTINKATFKIPDFIKYFRITVRDFNGKHAFTNAYFLDELK